MDEPSIEDVAGREVVDDAVEEELARLRAECDTRQVANDALREKLEELQAVVDRVAGTYSEPFSVEEWRQSVVARAARAGMPAGEGLCDWFERIARDRDFLAKKLDAVRSERNDARGALEELRHKTTDLVEDRRRLRAAIGALPWSAGDSLEIGGELRNCPELSDLHEAYETP